MKIPHAAPQPLRGRHCLYCGTVPEDAVVHVAGYAVIVLCRDCAMPWGRLVLDRMMREGQKDG